MRFRLLLFLQLFIFSIASGQNWDINLLKQINPDHETPAVGYNRFISDATSPVIVLLPIGLGIESLIKKDPEMEKKDMMICGAMLLQGGVVTGLKLAVQRERPFNAYPNEIYKYGKGGSYSFPSGHTGAAFAFATAFSLAYPKWYVIVPAYAFAASVGYSRMYLGVHYPTDVLAGALIGSGCSVAAYYLSKAYFKKHSPPFRFVLN